MSKHKQTTFSDYEVRVRAYRIWEKAGRPDGHAEDHWREALAELEAECRAEEAGDHAGVVPPQPEVKTPPARNVAEPLPKPEDAAA